MISSIYINIKKWLQLYGYEVLDYFIQVDNKDETDPRKRYREFDEQFNVHVGTSEHYENNQGWDTPFLAIDIVPDPLNKGCFKRYIVNFSVYYSSVSPITGRRCIENTPEGKLEYRDGVYQAICEMIYHQVKTTRGLKMKTFADDVASKDDWYLPIKVTPVKFGDLTDFSSELTDEVGMFSFPITLSIFEC